MVADGTAVPGTVVVADRQTRGRGRRGRSWLSPAGLGAYVSVLVEPVGPAAHDPRWTLAAAVAVAEACRRRVDRDVAIKWPNDVLAGGAKLAGILADAITPVGRPRRLVLGMGINVAHDVGDFPAELRSKATSLRRLGSDTMDREALVSDVLAGLFRLGERLAVGDWATVRSAWLALAAGVPGGRVGTPAGPGVTLGIDERGALRVRLSDSGETVAMIEGDAVTFPPTG
jgi:BirA family biotin operon repressor/biotin-[acetyl-CoA-carboxylase] ligase